MGDRYNYELRGAIKEAIIKGNDESKAIFEYLKKKGYRVKSIGWLRMFIRNQMGGDIEIIKDSNNPNKYRLRS